MDTTLDRFGRIVIPKRIRKALGLDAGAPLRIEREGGRVIVTPSAGEDPVEMEGNILVFTGRAVGDIEGAIAREREDRMDAVSAVAEAQ